MWTERGDLCFPEATANICLMVSRWVMFLTIGTRSGHSFVREVVVILIWGRWVKPSDIR